MRVIKTFRTLPVRKPIVIAAYPTLPSWEACIIPPHGEEIIVNGVKCILLQPDPWNQSHPNNKHLIKFPFNLDN